MFVRNRMTILLRVMMRVGTVGRKKFSTAPTFVLSRTMIPSKGMI